MVPIRLNKNSQFYIISAIVIILSVSLVVGFLGIPNEIRVSKSQIYEKGLIEFEKSTDFLDESNMDLIFDWASLDREFKEEIEVEENDNATLQLVSFEVDFPNDADLDSIEVFRDNERVPYLLEWENREKKIADFLVKDKVEPFEEAEYDVFANLVEPGEPKYPRDLEQTKQYKALNLPYNSNHEESDCFEPNYTDWVGGEVIEGGISFEFVNKTTDNDTIAVCDNFGSQEVNFTSPFIVDKIHFAIASNSTSCLNTTKLQLNYSGSSEGKNYTIYIPNHTGSCEKAVPYIQPIGKIGPGNLYHTAEDIPDGNISSLTLYKNNSFVLGAITLEGNRISRTVNYESQSYSTKVNFDSGGIIEDLKSKRTGLDLAEDFFNLKIGDERLNDSSATPIKSKESSFGRLLSFNSNLPSELIKGDYFLLPGMIKAEYTISYKNYTKGTNNEVSIIFDLEDNRDLTFKSGEDYVSLYNQNHSISIYTNFSEWKFKNSSDTYAPKSSNLLVEPGKIVFNATTEIENAREAKFDVFLEFHSGGKAYAKKDRKGIYASPNKKKSSSTIEEKFSARKKFLRHFYSRKGYSLSLKTQEIGFEPVEKKTVGGWQVKRKRKLPLKVYNPLKYHTTDWVFETSLGIRGKLSSLVVGDNLPYQLTQSGKNSELDLDLIESTLNYSSFSVEPFNISFNLPTNSDCNISVYRYGSKINETKLYSLSSLSPGSYVFKVHKTTGSCNVTRVNSTSPKLVLNQREFNITNKWTGSFYVFLPEEKNQISIRLNGSNDTYHSVYLRDERGNILEKTAYFAGEKWLNYSVENWKGGRFFILEIDKNRDWVSVDLSNLKLPTKNERTFFKPKKPKFDLLFQTSLQDNEIKKTGVYFDDQSYEDINFKTDLNVSGTQVNNSFFSLDFSQGLGWKNRTKITINSGLINGNLTDFPLLIRLNSSTNGFNFSKAKPNGSDIRVTDSENHLLDYEIERWDSSNNRKAEIWAKVPHVSNVTDTVLYLYYNNPKAEDAQKPKEVWDSNYTMVQHLDETSGDHYDSTRYDNDGTPKVVTQDATGKINGADEFDGSDDYVNTTDITNYQTNDFTVSAWIYPNDVTESGQRIVTDDTNGNGWSLSLGDPGTGKLRFYVRGMDTVSLDTGDIINSGQWSRVVGVFGNSDNERYIYVNGIEEASNTTDTGTPSTDAGTVKIGHSSGDYFNGTIDEVRVSNEARSAAWIKASYKNMDRDLVTYSPGQMPLNIDNRQVRLNIGNKSWSSESGIRTSLSKLHGNEKSSFSGLENISIKETGPLRAKLEARAANLKPFINYTLKSYSELPFLEVEVETKEVPNDLTLKNWISVEGGNDTSYRYEGLVGDYQIKREEKIDLEELKCPGLTWVGKRKGRKVVGVIFKCGELYPSERTVLVENKSIAVSFGKKDITYYLVSLEKGGFEELSRYAKRLEYLGTKKEVLHSIFNLETPRLDAKQSLIT